MRNATMLTPMRSVFAAIIVAAISAVSISSSLVVAQTPSGTALTFASHDARWQPWLGCWRPMQNATAPIRLETSEIQQPVSEQLICVVPGAASGSVEIVNFSGGTVTDRTTVVPGQSIPKKIDGCSGSEVSTWSHDGHRLIMKGTFKCDGGVTREESGIMSINEDGQWVQAQGITINGNSSVYVAQFRESGIAVEGVIGDALMELPVLDANGDRISPPRAGCTGTESVIRSPDRTRVTVKSDYMCANGLHRVADAEMVRTGDGRWVRADGTTVPFGTVTSRAIAGAPVSLDDVLEVAKNVDVTVSEAWLTSRGQGFELNGKQLVQAADAGMPSRIIDMMVAMSHPEKFALRRQTTATDEERQVSSRSRRAVADDCFVSNRYCYGIMGLNWLYGADRYYGWNSYGYNNGLYYGNRYGYNYGYGYWGPGYYTGNTPVIIVPAGSEPRGKAVYGKGYTRGTGSSSGGRSPDIGSGSRSSGSGGSTTSASGASGSSGSTAGSSSSGASSGSTGRTAKPRKTGPPESQL